jgi:two-component system OmpR family sensor kinase
VLSSLWTIRGKLVLWYLSVLAVLLIALGIFQSLTLSHYLSSSAAANLRQAAFAELRVLGPCFVQTSGDLQSNAQTLARLLGSHDVAVKIVTPTGETLADHGSGPPGASRPLRLSAATILGLISSTAPISPGSTSSTAPDCTDTGAAQTTRRRSTPPPKRAALRQGGLTLTAIPLGPFGHPVGYALLGRSAADDDATVAQTRLVFALGALAALVVAGIVALPLINRALRPLRRVAGTAEAIAAGDLQQRANLSHSPDEIGRLGRSFDTMVDRLQAALTRANESEEKMRRFLADASHELRTPLTVLRGTSEVLLRQQRKQPTELTSAIEDIHEEAVRLSKLVDDLLTLTRLDEGQPLNPEEVQVRSFLEQLTERYASAWPNRQITLELDGLNGAEAYVDPDALRRIVTNLIDNAARYSTPGRPITLGGEAGREGITVFIGDEGPGLSPEDAARIFERFYRGSRSRSRQAAGQPVSSSGQPVSGSGQSNASSGTGLGLAIVQALVEQSGGEVHIDTAPGRGTTVSVDLPQR